jgi:metallo-beta-lactamase class B
MGTAVALFLSAGMIASVQGADGGDPALAAKHDQIARNLAGDSLKAVTTGCNNIGKSLVIPEDQLHAGLAKVIGQGRLPPTKVFHNLYFVGAKWVSAWAITTEDGIILLDALNNEQEARDYIEGGLKELGLDPASIKKIIVTHAHGDHYGGAKYLQEKYRAQVIMSDIDWRELEKPKLQYDDSLWGRPPKRDVSVKDGDKVTLGSTSVTTYVTAGHTPGTLSFVFPVKDNGKPHVAMLWGGNGFNFGKVSDRFVSYIQSTERFRNMAKPSNIDIFLSNHAGLDGTEHKMAKLKSRDASNVHPFVVGTETVERTMTILGECGKAVLASFDAKAVPTGK